MVKDEPLDPERSAAREILMRDAVPYEVWMMREAFQLMTSGQFPQGSPARNTVIEAFAIHCRALISFFSGKDGSDARHFTDASYIPFGAGAIDKKLVGRLSQQIAHITERRVSEPGGKLNTPDWVVLLKALNTEVAEFQRHLLPEYKAIWGVHLPLASSVIGGRGA